MRSFDVIVGVFAQQLVEGDSYSFMTENILIVAELVSWLRVDSGMYNRRQYTIILYLYQLIISKACSCKSLHHISLHFANEALWIKTSDV